MFVEAVSESHPAMVQKWGVRDAILSRAGALSSVMGWRLGCGSALDYYRRCHFLLTRFQHSQLDLLIVQVALIFAGAIALVAISKSSSSR